MAGKAYLIGAGPGDPGLITLKGSQILAQADAVLYDERISARLVGLVRPDADRIFLGNTRRQRTWRREAIVQELIDRVNRGQKVVLLLYGDPLSLPGASEEAVALAASQVEWEIVPGVSPGLAAATYAGIPLAPLGVEPSITLVHLTGSDPTKSPCRPRVKPDTKPKVPAGDTILETLAPASLPADPPTAADSAEEAARELTDTAPPETQPEAPTVQKPEAGTQEEKRIGRSVIIRRRGPTSPGTPNQPTQPSSSIRILKQDLVELVDDPEEPTGTTLATKKVISQDSESDLPDDEQLFAAPDWDALAHSGGTLVINLDRPEAIGRVVAKLLEHGRSPEEAAAVIESGTLNTQRTLCMSLGALVHELNVVGVHGGCVLVIGDGVNLREYINWFEERPFSGLRIALTDFADRAAEQARALEEKGAITFSTPLMLAAVLPDAIEALKNAVSRLSTYDMIVFSSPIPVKVFVEALRELGKDPRTLSGPRFVAISTLTAFELARNGIHADMLIEESSTQWLVETLGVDPGDRILLPRAAQARDLLPLEIQQRGALAEMIPVYEIFPDVRGLESLADLIRRRCLDMIIHTSNASVERLWESLGPVERGLMQETILHVAYGSLTARALASRGLRVQWRLVDLTPERLVESIQARLTSMRTNSTKAAPKNSEKALS